MSIIARAVSIALACLLAPAFAPPATANPGSESKVWYVPQPAKAGKFDQSGIEITNLNGRDAKVYVRSFNKQGPVSDYSEVFTVPAGKTGGSALGPPAKRREVTYTLVISDQPVLVVARVWIALRSAAERECSDVGILMANDEAICPGDSWVYLHGAKERASVIHQYDDDYLYHASLISPAYPIDCANAQPNHFACSQRLPTITGGGGAGAVTGPKTSGVGPADKDPAFPGGAEDPSADEPLEKDPAAEEEPAPPSPEGGETISAGMDDNWDRPGGDLLNFQLPSRDPGVCKRACDVNALCKAWSYWRPGYSGYERAVCRLKRSVPEKVESPCCISGVK